MAARRARFTEPPGQVGRGDRPRSRGSRVRRDGRAGQFAPAAELQARGGEGDGRLLNRRPARARSGRRPRSVAGAAIPALGGAVALKSRGPPSAQA